MLPAAIAALHAGEPRDWDQIAALYGELSRLAASPPHRLAASPPRRLTASPPIELSRAVGGR